MQTTKIFADQKPEIYLSLEKEFSTLWGISPLLTLLPNRPHFKFVFLFVANSMQILLPKYIVSSEHTHE